MQNLTIKSVKEEIVRAKDANEWPALDLSKISFEFREWNQKGERVVSSTQKLSEQSESDQIVLFDIFCTVDQTGCTPIGQTPLLKKLSQVAFFIA